MVSKPMLLIIDANTDTVSDLVSILSDSYQIIVASTAQDARRLYHDLHMKVRLVLLNSTIPDTHVANLLRDLRSFSTIPEFVVYSEKENIQDAVTAIKHGAVAYLTTPFFKDSLLQALEKALEEYDIITKLDDVASHKHTFDSTELRSLFSKTKSLYETGTIRLSSDDYTTLTDMMACFDSATQPEKQFNQPKVLVVEDEPMYQNTLQTFLGDLYDVHWAYTGKDAIEKMNEVDFDVILLDVFLPDCSGADLLPQLKGLNPVTQIIVVTAFEFLEIAVTTLKDGACDYLHKPFLKNELLDSVRRAVDLKYQQYDLPNLLRQRIDTEISQSGKLTLLDVLSKQRPDKAHHLYMEDVYLFFPDLRKSCIPDTSPVPYKVTETNNLSGFISSLIQSELVNNV